MKNNRGKDWGTGWDGRSRIPDKTYKENFDSIDWSSTKKENDKNKSTDTSKNSKG